jgi:NADPH:quinone reductase-like Zn-dependent oxidoreductase
MLERMHAIVQRAFGGPEVLEVAEIDRPVPLATEVLVRVKAVGVNPLEPLIRSIRHSRGAALTTAVGRRGTRPGPPR